MIRFCILIVAVLSVCVSAPASAQSESVVLLVNPKSGVKSVADFVAWAKRSKKPLAFSSSDPASQRFGDTLAQKIGIKTVHIPYRAPSQGILDLIGGHIDFSVVDVGAAVGQIQGGLVTALAVAAKQRMPDFPDVPTFAEAGYPELAGLLPGVNPTTKTTDVMVMFAHARH
jgi:tripartite-type tricarboxylate transporter receptor subunit TctC